jgi:hypothetical protein
MTESKNRIMIFGPKADGTYVIEFRTATGEVLAISIPRTEAAVIRYFQERMPYGLSLTCNLAQPPFRVRREPDKCRFLIG